MPQDQGWVFYVFMLMFYVNDLFSLFLFYCLFISLRFLYFLFIFLSKFMYLKLIMTIIWYKIICWSFKNCFLLDGQIIHSHCNDDTVSLLIRRWGTSFAPPIFLNWTFTSTSFSYNSLDSLRITRSCVLV